MFTLFGRRTAGPIATTPPSTTKSAGTSPIGNQAAPGATSSTVPAAGASVVPGIVTLTQVAAPTSNPVVPTQQGTGAPPGRLTIGGDNGIQPVQVATLIAALITLLVAFVAYAGNDSQPGGRLLASLTLLILGSIAGVSFVAMTIVAVVQQRRKRELSWKVITATLACLCCAIILLPWGTEERQQAIALQVQISDRRAIYDTIIAFSDAQVMWY